MENSPEKGAERSANIKLPSFFRVRIAEGEDGAVNMSFKGGLNDILREAEVLKEALEHMEWRFGHTHSSE